MYMFYFIVQVRSSPERCETKTDPGCRLTSRAPAGGRRGSCCVARRSQLGGRGESRLQTGVCLHQLVLLFHATDSSTTDTLSLHGATFPAATELVLGNTHACSHSWRHGICPAPKHNPANQRRSQWWRRCFTAKPVGSCWNIFVTATFHNLHVYLFPQWTHVTFQGFDFIQTRHSQTCCIIIINLHQH